MQNLSKFKAIADDKLNVTQEMRSDFQRVDNIVGKDLESYNTNTRCCDLI